MAKAPLRVAPTTFCCTVKAKDRHLLFVAFVCAEVSAEYLLKEYIFSEHDDIHIYT